MVGRQRSDTVRHMNEIRRLRKGNGSDVVANILEAHETAVAAVAGTSDDRLRHIREKLHKFQQKQGERATRSTQQFDWIQEYRRLEKEEKTTSRLVESALSNFSSTLRARTRKHSSPNNDREENQRSGNGTGDSCYSDETTNMPGKAVESFRNIDKEYCPGSGRVKLEVQGLFDGLKQALTLLRSTQNDGSDAKPILAEMFLQVRERLSELDASLDREFEETQSEVKELQKGLSKALRDGRHEKGRDEEGQLPEILTLELNELSMSADDCLEVSVLRSELVVLFQEAQKEYSDALCEARVTNEERTTIEWDERSRTIFSKIFSEFDRSSSATRKKKAMDQLLLQLPDKSNDECVQYWKIFESARARKRKKLEATEQFKRKRETLLQQGQEQIKALKATFVDRANHCAAVRVKQAMQSEQHARLRMLREARAQAQKKDAEQKQRDDAEKAKYLSQQQNAWRKHHLSTKAYVEEYKKQKERLAEDESAEEQRRQHQQGLGRLRRAETDRKRSGKVHTFLSNNVPDFLTHTTCSLCWQRTYRVTFRQQQREGRKQKALESIIQASRSEELRLERLSALAASVPYYSKIMNLEADPLRMTIARTNDIYEPAATNGLADFQQGALRSFSNEKVFSDLRFRLGNALHEAGVAQTPYARAVIKKLVPRAPERTTGIEPH